MFDKSSMKKVLLYLLAAVFIAYGIGFSIFISYKAGNKELKAVNSDGKGSSSSTIDQVKEESISSINEIAVETSSMKINVIQEKRDNVKAHMSGSIMSLTNVRQPILETSVSGNTLYIRVVNKSMISFTFYYNVELDVYIPSDYSKDLKLTTSSGSIEINDLKLNSLNCKLSSGSLKFNKVTADNFNFSSSSGSFKGSGLYTKKASMECSSGSISVEDLTGDLTANSSSGSINVSYKEFNNTANLHASSGSVMLRLPQNSEFKLSANASSGSISCDFPVTVSGDQKRNHLEGVVKSDKNKVTANTSSGSIKIKTR